MTAGLIGRVSRHQIQNKLPITPAAAGRTLHAGFHNFAVLGPEPTRQATRVQGSFLCVLGVYDRGLGRGVDEGGAAGAGLLLLLLRHFPYAEPAVGRAGVGNASSQPAVPNYQAPSAPHQEGDVVALLRQVLGCTEAGPSAWGIDGGGGGARGVGCQNVWRLGGKSVLLHAQLLQLALNPSYNPPAHLQSPPRSSCRLRLLLPRPRTPPAGGGAVQRAKHHHETARFPPQLVACRCCGCGPIKTTAFSSRTVSGCFQAA